MALRVGPRTQGREFEFDLDIGKKSFREVNWLSIVGKGPWTKWHCANPLFGRELCQLSVYACCCMYSPYWTGLTVWTAAASKWCHGNPYLSWCSRVFLLNNIIKPRILFKHVRYGTRKFYETIVVLQSVPPQIFWVTGHTLTLTILHPSYATSLWHEFLSFRARGRGRSSRYCLECRGILINQSWCTKKDSRHCHKKQPELRLVPSSPVFWRKTEICSLLLYFRAPKWKRKFALKHEIFHIIRGNTWIYWLKGLLVKFWLLFIRSLLENLKIIKFRIFHKKMCRSGITQRKLRNYVGEFTAVVMASNS